MAKSKAVQKKQGKGFSLSDFPIASLLLAVLGLVIAAVFIFTPDYLTPLEREDLELHVGSYDGYQIVYDGVGSGMTETLMIFFEDDAYFCKIHPSCVNSELKAKIKALNEGDMLAVMSRPDEDYAVEILNKGKEILNFDASQEAMKKEGATMFRVGVGILGVALVAAGYAAYVLIKNKRKKDRA